jgi:hypothetical protein
MGDFPQAFRRTGPGPGTGPGTGAAGVGPARCTTRGEDGAR